MASQELDTMIGPPIARGMRALDRSFFQKTVNLRAARVFDNKNIATIRSQLEKSKDALRMERIANVHPDPDPDRRTMGKKCILLQPAQPQNAMTNGSSHSVATSESPNHEHNTPSSTTSSSPILRDLVEKELVSIVPFDLSLDYDYWTYHEIITAILPLDAQEEIPSGFTQVGHVAHLNLRDQYLQYKNLIAEILLDKNPTVRTVINKVDDVGQESEFRTFRYEVLAGPDDMNVILSEADCTFSFDYSKVYWNSRLQTEHLRLVKSFHRGDAVCDVMAGIGPFAVPAGKRGVFVWANDLNPDSYISLTDAIAKNKVGDFVQAFNKDGRTFIRSAAAELLHTEHSIKIKKKGSRKSVDGSSDILEALNQPKTFQHFVLNLPASALTFLPSFIGLYAHDLRGLLPEGNKMPLIHVYCFGTKDELQRKREEQGEAPVTPEHDAVQVICNEISQQLGYQMQPGNTDSEGCVEVYDVRDVAPKKRMFCASFRLPEEVAFRTT